MCIILDSCVLYQFFFPSIITCSVKPVRKGSHGVCLGTRVEGFLPVELLGVDEKIKSWEQAIFSCVRERGGEMEFQNPVDSNPRWKELNQIPFNPRLVFFPMIRAGRCDVYVPGATV